MLTEFKSIADAFNNIVNKSYSFVDNKKYHFFVDDFGNAYACKQSCFDVSTDSFIEFGSIVAMCICLVTLIMPVFFRELRQSKSMVAGYCFVVVLHQVVAFVTAYNFLPRFPDSLGFHLWGEVLARTGDWRFSIGAGFYKQALAAVYRWFSPSHLLGQQLSVLVFAFSCVIFLKIMQELGAVRYRLSSLLAFGALPTMVLLGSMTLRESYQVFFFMLAVYFGLKMHTKGWPNVYFVALILSALGMGWFHTALIAYAAILFLIFVVWSLRPATRLWNIKKLRLAAFMIIPLSLVGVVALSKVEMNEIQTLSYLLNQNWLDVVSRFRTNSIIDSGRTTYGVYLDLSSTYMTVYSGLKLYVYYLFAPFPWQVNSFMGLYAGMESIMRMILIYFSVKQWRKAYGSQRRLLGLMLILYFSMTFMWALGTTNYGTAMRHHMLSWWIIVIAGFPPLMARLEIIFPGLELRKDLHSNG